MSNLTETQQEEVIELLVDCRKSMKKFCQTFFPEVFYIPFSSLHDKIFDLIDNSDHPQKMIKAPRGLGKSSIMNLAYPVRQIIYRDTNYLIQASESADQAIADSADVKDAVVYNKTINQLFSPFKPTEREDEFSKKIWQTAELPAMGDEPKANGTLIRPTSWKQRIRGTKHGQYRPDCIIVDDLEGSEEAQSETQREKLLNWFYADLLNTVQRSRLKAPSEHKWRVIVIGTLLHEDSLINRLTTDPNWEVLELSICTVDLKSNWPDFHTDEDIVKLYNSYKAQGLLDKFAQEHMGIVMDPESAIFKSSMFKYYEEAELKDIPLSTVILVDPAKTDESYSCDTAIVCWSFDARNSKLYLRDIEFGKHLNNPKSLQNAVFAMAKRFDVQVVGIETAGLNSYITHPFKDAMFNAGLNFEFVELSPKGVKKDDRIFGLATYYRRGWIYHNRTAAAPLELQLLSMPKSKRKDIADAASYIVPMLDIGGRFFISRINKEDGVFEDQFKKLQSRHNLSPLNRSSLYNHPLTGLRH